MKLTVLAENTALRQELTAVHGLSLWLECAGKHILFDVGPGDEFLRNARVLGVPVESADICVLSHGHYDHGGGLCCFLENNSKAPVYAAAGAFLPHAHVDRFIGLKAELAENSRIRFTEGSMRPAEGLLLLSDIPGDCLLPPANGGMLEEDHTDGFRHEQVLLAEENGRLLLLGGCAHRGIVNILQHVYAVCGRYPDAVLSGFHLAAGGQGACMADDAYLSALAERLLETGAVFYTCHCTGKTAFDKLKEKMGGQLQAVSAGSVLCF